MLTRRQALKLGAASGVTAMLGRVGSGRAAGVAARAPKYLRRSSWVPLVGATLGVARVTLRLAEVADLPHRAGRDDAFRLEFTSAPGALPGAIHSFRTEALGTFDLFVSPVDTVVNDLQRYEVIIDRSVLAHPVPSRHHKQAAARRKAIRGQAKIAG